MKHTLSILVENRFGVLARVAGLFSARGYNIDSLAVSETQDPTISRMTIVVNAQDERILEQIKKQLNKLIDIITITDFTKKAYLEEELLFVKLVFSTKEELAALEQLIKKSGGRVLDQKEESLIAQVVGDQACIGGFLGALKEYKILELVRTGRIAIAK